MSLIYGFDKQERQAKPREPLDDVASLVKLVYGLTLVFMLGLLMAAC